MTFSSMTGFARKEGHRRDLSWTWEVKSVNGRTLDIRCRLPPGLDSFDPQIRALAQAAFRRGSLYVTLEMRRAAGAETIMVNEAALAQIVAIASDLRRKHRLAAPSPEGLLALRGVLELGPVEEDSDGYRGPRRGACFLTLTEYLQASRRCAVPKAKSCA